MRVGRIIKRVLLAALLCLLAAAAFLYVQAGRSPEGYRPAQLTGEQADAVASDFINVKIFDEFGNRTQDNKPFDWTLTEQDANKALAAMDEIAYRLGAPEGTVKNKMDRVGLSQPAVRFMDGRLVMMVRSTEYDKVLSVEMSFTSLPDGLMKVGLEGMSVGRQPIPQSLVLDRFGALAAAIKPDDQAASQGSSQSTTGEGMVRAKDVGKLLREVIGAANGQPILPEFKWPVSNRRVRIQSVDLSDGLMTLHVAPVVSSKGPSTRHKGTSNPGGL
jgi:hypothetical protein